MSRSDVSVTITGDFDLSGQTVNFFIFEKSGIELCIRG